MTASLYARLELIGRCLDSNLCHFSTEPFNIMITGGSSSFYVYLKLWKCPRVWQGCHFRQKQAWNVVHNHLCLDMQDLQKKIILPCHKGPQQEMAMKKTWLTQYELIH